ncbi:DUF4129 domain-containing protein [Kitasatospora sp. NPDC127111]|uniref:DUF4129 domain-containing protein n=1 Tax=Kitasatospora sp. NPDC127111 TaxID=3345363 RepID=UPI003630E307
MKGVVPRGPGVAAGLLVVGGLLPAAAALRPVRDGVLGTAVGGPVGSTGFVLLLAIGWGVLVGRFAVRFREEVRHLDGPTPWAERLRTAATVLLPGAAVAVPVLMLVFHGRVDAGPADPPHPVQAPVPTLSASPPPPAEPAEPGDGGVLGAIAGVVTAALAATVVVLFVIALVVALRRLRLRRVRARPVPPLPAAPPRPEEVLAEAVATGLRALGGSDARAAVIACYAAMEGSLAASGVSRRVSENPTELLERAVTDERVDRFHAEALTALFREARYSTHPMDDAHVRRARTALDAIAAGLANGGPADDGRADDGPANEPAAAAAAGGHR